MAKKTYLKDTDLAVVAKQMREAAGKRKIDVSRELGVSSAAVSNAEEKPDLPLTKLRIRIIGTYSKHRVVGPVYYLERKK